MGLSDDLLSLMKMTPAASCVGEFSPLAAYSNVIMVVNWIKGIIGDCNEKTCNGGMCMNKDNLHPWTLKEFSRVSPHLTAKTM